MQKELRCRSTTRDSSFRILDCGGEPVVRSTRVTVRTVLASLAEGATIAEILEDFPSLNQESVRAVIAFAAARRQRTCHFPHPRFSLKIKLDENLPARLARDLETWARCRHGHRRRADWRGRRPSSGWLRSENPRFFITQDLDFSDIRRFQPGSHAGCSSFAYAILVDVRSPAVQRRSRPRVATGRAVSW